jgi:hypothetical protein
MLRISFLIILALAFGAWTHGRVGGGGGGGGFLFGGTGGALSCNGGSNACLLDNVGGRLIAL